MQGIKKAIDKFDYNNVTKSYYGKCHEALIGEWVNWWLRKTKKSSERRIINPAIQASYYGNYTADILFCERDNRSKSYKALGVAEVENEPNKYLYKLKSLNAYIFSKGKKREQKFPDLEFVLLSTRQKIDKEGNITNFHFNLYEAIKEQIINYSEKSDVYWIYYQMKLKSHPYESPDETFDIDYLRDAEKFWYAYSFEDKPDYLIVRKGKLIKEVPQ